jgi:hypothetical protein
MNKNPQVSGTHRRKPALHIRLDRVHEMMRAIAPVAHDHAGLWRGLAALRSYEQTTVSRLDFSNRPFADAEKNPTAFPRTPR